MSTTLTYWTRHERDAPSEASGKHPDAPGRRACGGRDAAVAGPRSRRSGRTDQPAYDLIELLFFAYRDFVGDADRLLESYRVRPGAPSRAAFRQPPSRPDHRRTARHPAGSPSRASTACSRNCSTRAMSRPQRRRSTTGASACSLSRRRGHELAHGAGASAVAALRPRASGIAGRRARARASAFCSP